MNEMTELQKYLDHAFNVLSCISVKGDDVEIMAEVRATLRKVYKMAGEKKEQEETEDG